jgi:hypothetical protein
MRFKTFVGELEAAGWRNTLDAQYTNIKCMWRTMYPVVAELEDENEELYLDIQEYVDEQPPI